MMMESPWNDATKGLIASLADAQSNLAIWAEVTIDGNGDTIDEIERELRLALSVVEKIKGPQPCVAILFGSPLDGFKAHGPFPTEEAANVWAEEMGEGGEWPITIHPITPDSCHGLYPWDKPAVPAASLAAKTVLEYYEAMFAGVALEDAGLADAMRSMPLASTCGQDCREAIDAGWALLGKLEMAHGDGTGRENLGRTVAALCGTFICG
jgi:hypothetical protein